MSGVAEGMSRLSLSAAQLILSTGSVPSTADVKAKAITAGTDAGDFSLAYGTVTTDTIPVTATGKAGTPAATGTATGTWNKPQ